MNTIKYCNKEGRMFFHVLFGIVRHSAPANFVAREKVFVQGMGNVSYVRLRMRVKMPLCLSSLV